MNYLFVVAHPDDETLGAGGMIHSLLKKGNKVTVCIMSSKAEKRSVKASEKEHIQQIMKSFEILGNPEMILGNFPNIAFNVIPHIELVQFIESAIVKVKPDVVVTHYPDDLNLDHRETSEACQAAIRIFQRNGKDTYIKKFMYMEVLSATDWNLESSFHPNYFYEIGKTGVDTKIKSLESYTGGMRNFPHPRCEENIRALATYRGCQAGINFAEAFQIVFEKDK